MGKNTAECYCVQQGTGWGVQNCDNFVDVAHGTTQVRNMVGVGVSECCLPLTRPVALHPFKNISSSTREGPRRVYLGLNFARRPRTLGGGRSGSECGINLVPVMPQDFAFLHCHEQRPPGRAWTLLREHLPRPTIIASVQGDHGGCTPWLG